MGGFPAFQDMNRQTVRAPVNPLDKATIVSIYPRKIREVKVTMQPGIFEIPAGTLENPGVLIVTPSSWWKEVDLNQPLLEIPVSAVRVADSVIKDYCNGIIGIDVTNKMLGWFYVPGEFSVERVKKELKAELENAARKQKAWFEELINISDILWSHSNGNPLAISDDAKLAAEYLGMKDKPWMSNAIMAAMKNCPACGTLVNPGFPVCPNCHTIVDKAAYDKMGLVKAS